jgi:hypothetical protein
VFSRQRNLSNRHDAPAWASGSHATTESRGAEYTSGNDPTVNNADAPWYRTTQTVADRLNAPNAGIRCNHWIIEVDDHHAIIGNAVCEESLHAAVGPNASMPIQVINGHVREHANIDG